MTAIACEFSLFKTGSEKSSDQRNFLSSAKELIVDNSVVENPVCFISEASVNRIYGIPPESGFFLPSVVTGQDQSNFIASAKELVDMQSAARNPIIFLSGLRYYNENPIPFSSGDMFGYI